MRQDEARERGMRGFQERVATFVSDSTLFIFASFLLCKDYSQVTKFRDRKTACKSILKKLHHVLVNQRYGNSGHCWRL